MAAETTSSSAGSVSIRLLQTGNRKIKKAQISQQWLEQHQLDTTTTVKKYSGSTINA